MRSWNLKQLRKSRPETRVSAYLKPPPAYEHDAGDDHAFSTSSNGYGPQVISDPGFHPNKISTRPNEDEIVLGISSNRQLDSPVSQSSSLGRKYLEPWSASTVSGSGGTNPPSKHLNQEHEYVPGPIRNGLWSWIPHTSQSADDVDVLSQVKGVFLFAEQFVNNFYTDRAFTKEIELEKLDKVNRSQLLPKSQLQECLTKAAYPTTVIKHVLVSLILDMISFASVGNEGCLLPKEFRNYIALTQAMNRSDDAEIPHVQPALSAYRVLSVYVHPNFESDQNYLSDRIQVSKEMAAAFHPAFDQWLEEEKSKEDWELSFSRLMEKTARLGTFLFSQPSVFIFDWEMMSEDQSARLLPVHPRLLRVFDEEGQHKDFSDHLIPMKCGETFRTTDPEPQEQDSMLALAAVSEK